MTLIDTHAHLYLEEFRPVIGEIMSKTLAAGVEQVLLPAIDAEEHENLLWLADQYPANCLAMMGLHPCYVKENMADELAAVERQLATRPFVGVGEIGLDFYWDRTFEAAQYDAFRQQLLWSKNYQLPVSIHSRNATDEAIDVVSGLQDGGLSGVFHCFGGSVEQARKIMDLGFYLGIGGVLTYKNSGLSAVLKAVGHDRLVLETDAPYLAPVPYRGKRNQPAYLTEVVTFLADVFAMPVADMAAITTANARNVFKLPVHEQAQ